MRLEPSSNLTVSWSQWLCHGNAISLLRWVNDVRANFCARQTNLRVIQPLHTFFLSSVTVNSWPSVKTGPFARMTPTDSGTFIKLFGILSPLSLFNPMSFFSDQRNARSRLQNNSGEYFQALSRYTQDVCVEFLVNQQGPKVPWVLVFFDFVGCYPDLPEWVDGKKLQHFLNLFKTRFRRFCKGRKIHFISSLHESPRPPFWEVEWFCWVVQTRLYSQSHFPKCSFFCSNWLFWWVSLW